MALKVLGLLRVELYLLPATGKKVIYFAQLYPLRAKPVRFSFSKQQNYNGYNYKYQDNCENRVLYQLEIESKFPFTTNTSCTFSTCGKTATISSLITT